MSSIHDKNAPLAIHPIGIIRSPFKGPSGTPVQPVYGQEVEGEVWVEEAYQAALADLEGFERVWLIYWLDRAGPFRSRVIPYRDTREHGLFSTRAPCRPNPIGLSVVRLLRREGNVLYVADLDILDRTPLLDIKPYVPRFDSHPSSRAGWLDEGVVDGRVADSRFHPDKGAHDGPADQVRFPSWSPLCDIVSGDELVLKLDETCVQTTAKRARQQLVEAYLQQTEPQERLEQAIDLLGRFLENTDFRQLRADHPELAGGQVRRVRVFRGEGGAIRWEMVPTE